MRVLMAIRPDALTKLGGDTVQMQNTARALRGLGVEVEERIGAADDETMRRADLVHLFNLQTPEFTLPEARRAAALGKPIAVSTIYWDFGAERLLMDSARWGRIARFVGRGLALRLARRRVNQAARADRAMLAEILELSSCWLPNSRAEIDHLRRLTHAERAVSVVPNAVDPERFDPARTFPLPSWAAERGLKTRGYVLVAARVDRDKNQLAFCRALSGSELPVVLAGVAPDRSLLEACTGTGAHWIGELAGDDLVAAYAHARVHALPSFRETPGLASLEAAAMGCAIVSTSIGSAREYFGDEARYCDPLSASSMRMAVEEAWASRVHESLSARVRREFTWGRAAEATLEAYGRIYRA